MAFILNTPWLLFPFAFYADGNGIGNIILSINIYYDEY